MTYSFPAFSSAPTTEFYAYAVENEYFFECPCGECHKSIASAVACSKCRKYSYFPGRYVYDLRDGSVCYGDEPSYEGRQEAREEQDRADRIAELEYASYLEELALEEEERREAEREAYIDSLYAIEDRLMGYK